MEADVPLAALLSGGLDSTILCRIAADRDAGLNTWCAGGQDTESEGDDLGYAREAAELFGTRHHEVLIDQARFARDWPRLVQESGVPLSTPNEVAIHAVCRELRAQGCVVALNGEGADELFGGYELALQAAAAFSADVSDGRGGGQYHLEASAWVPPAIKQRLLAPDAWRAAAADALLYAFHDGLYDRCEVEAGEHASALDVHLRFQRHNNLTGLLQRLDSSSMLASVEGRTPFSDVRIAELANRLPMNTKFEPETAGAGGIATAISGKLVLRRAWRGRIPAAIEARTKQSFPLPFEGWMSEQAQCLLRSEFAKEFFAPDIRLEIARDPSQYWRCAWPAINLALWGEVWWG